MPYALAEVPWPSSPHPGPLPVPPAEVFLSRLAQLCTLMQQEDIPLAVIYADREHFANLHFFTHFDPRFEEAILLVTPDAPPLLLTGNECQGYLPISPLHAAGELRHELFRPLSLEGQDRSLARPMASILTEAGCRPGRKVALIGAKTWAHPHASDLPAWLVDTLRGIAGFENCLNRTHWLIHPQDGLRIRLSVHDLAAFEVSNTKAGDALRRVCYALRPGLTDQQLLAEALQYDGTPLSAHLTCKTGPKRISLASAAGHTIERGHKWSANIAYWGANICRAAWVGENEADLPPAARDYVEVFAGPYFAAMVQWLQSLALDADCGRIHDATLAALPHDMFHVELNPGHHIGYDEWPNSPFFPGSTVRLQSGMVLQSDVIPSHPVYFSARLEEGYALADANLRRELAELYPASWARITARRELLANRLGIHLNEAVLPLSNTSGLMAPFALAPERVFINPANP